MKISSYFCYLVATIVFTSCTSPQISPKNQSETNQSISSQPKKVTLDDQIKIATGQTIYVPVYSHIYHENQQRTFNLAATLSIRNTDLNHAIIITSVRYYNSNGQLVKQYLEQPVQLNALASIAFVVERTDTSGGLGANFIVEWIAQQVVSEPIVEAVMIGTVSTQGISFVSPGRVIKRYTQKK